MKKKILVSLSITLFVLIQFAIAQVKKSASPKSQTSSTIKIKKQESAASLSGMSDISPRIKITTDSGVMIIKLYDSTPKHRDNFIKLVKEGFYDSLLFHRVIPDFMIQGGDPTSKNAPSGVMLGNGGDNMERIPAEFKPDLFHKKGALAAARDGNPQKASSACQFYLVEGKLITDADLDMLEIRKGKKYTAEQRNIYKTYGGTPFLDQEYTVFGEVESGLEVIQKITSVPKDGNNRPLRDVRMTVELIK